MIDQLPAVIGFAEARITQLGGNMAVGREDESRIDELKMVVTLCKGLQWQNEQLDKVLQAKADV